MKKIVTGFCLLSIVLLAFKPAFELAIGDPLPKADVMLKDVSGKFVTLKSTTKAKGILVVFISNSDVYVRINQDRLKYMCNYALENNIGVVLLNSCEYFRDKEESFTNMQSYATTQGYVWPYALDSNSVIADAFDAQRTPTCYLFNKDAKLEYRGALDDSPGDAASVKRQFLKNAIDEMNAGKEVSVKTSRSVGSAIRRKPL